MAYQRSIAGYMLVCLVTISSLTVSANTLKDTCTAGLYIKNIYDLKPPEYSYNADFWIWFDYKHKAFDPLSNVEVINAKETSYTDQYHANIDSSTFVASESGRIILIHNWQVENYPFDKQSFKIELEAGLDTTKMILTADKANFKVYSGLILPGWQLNDYSIKEYNVTYESDFGDRQLKGRSTFSHITYIVNVQRQGWGLFFKLMLGAYVAFLVAYLAYFLPLASEQRFSLNIGALFAAVANKYITDSNIPASISFSYIDQVHISTFIFILVTMAVSVIVLKLERSKKHRQSLRLNRISASIILLAYISLNITLLLLAYL